jgi:hypothetical protein
MASAISSYTYLVADRAMLITYDDDTSEVFTEAEALRYIDLTGRTEDAIFMGWTDVSDQRELS